MRDLQRKALIVGFRLNAMAFGCTVHTTRSLGSFCRPIPALYSNTHGLCNPLTNLKIPTNQQQSLERLDDASTELMMSSDGDNVMLLIGESFFDTSEEEATEFCDAEVERMTEVLEKLDEEEEAILEEQKDLKKILYGRFGKSIQLEEKV